MRVLVAGIGNIFLGDDGFGVHVVERLAENTPPDGVRFADFGIRGLHLAYELLDGYDVLVLVDAIAGRGTPGAVSVIEAEMPTAAPDALDAHGMTPDVVLGLLRNLGGTIGKTFVVGCEPVDCSEGIGLSPAVHSSVDQAVDLTRDLLEEIVGRTAAF